MHGRMPAEMGRSNPSDSHVCSISGLPEPGRAHLRRNGHIAYLMGIDARQVLFEILRKSFNPLATAPWPQEPGTEGVTGPQPGQFFQSVQFEGTPRPASIEASSSLPGQTLPARRAPAARLGAKHDLLATVPTGSAIVEIIILPVPRRLPTACT